MVRAWGDDWPEFNQSISVERGLPLAIRTHSFDGIPPAPREDEFITTIYKRFGEGTSVGFLLSTVNFVPLNCKHLWYFFLQTWFANTPRFFFVHWDSFISKSFFFFTPRSHFQIYSNRVGFWEVPGARTTSARSQEADQPIKILDPWKSNDTWAQHLQLGLPDVFGPTKTQGDRGFVMKLPMFASLQKKA